VAFAALIGVAVALWLLARRSTVAVQNSSSCAAQR
jgi:hypothetical protein